MKTLLPLVMPDNSETIGSAFKNEPVLDGLIAFSWRTSRNGFRRFVVLDRYGKFIREYEDL